jgi:hypothetical protein
MRERVMKMDKKMEEQIRQIVREEIAAHEERRHQEVIFFSRCDCRTDSVKPYYGQPVSFSNQ